MGSHFVIFFLHEASKNPRRPALSLATMRISIITIAATAAASLALAGCQGEETGPLSVAAIGAPARLANPNLEPLDAPSAFLVEAAAQGLVRFDAAGEIEPALAQRWILSDDGLRYTFRLARATWSDGSPVTAEQVAARLRAATSSSSRNPLKPILGAIDEIVAMTDEVLEISLTSPRPNFLQLLAQPQMGILRNGQGSGPYRAEAAPGGAVRLALPRDEAEDGEVAPVPRHQPAIRLFGERAAGAILRFREGGGDLVIGGTLGDLPLAREARLPANALVFDPAAGLFGLSVASIDGALARPEIRQALAMAIDRPSLVRLFGIPGLQPRETLLPGGTEGLAPALPSWAALPLADRRALAARSVRTASPAGPLRIRVAIPDGDGFRLLFAALRRDWAAVGIAAERVPAAEKAADLRLIDEVAPVGLASWYLRHFTCTASRVCDPAVDEMMAAARVAPAAPARRALLAAADRSLAESTPFIPLTTPVRWSLVSQRLNGFRPNGFARHYAGELIREQP